MSILFEDLVSFNWLAAVFSSAYKSNCVVFGFSMIIFIMRISLKFGFSISFVIWMILLSAQFILTSVLLANKDKLLWQIILKNEKLAKEMRRLLEVFPYGVIIQLKNSSPETSNVFTNDEFNKNVLNVKSRIEELSSVKIEFKDEDKANDTENHGSSLLESNVLERNYDLSWV